MLVKPEFRLFLLLLIFSINGATAQTLPDTVPVNPSSPDSLFSITPAASSDTVRNLSMPLKSGLEDSLSVQSKSKPKRSLLEDMVDYHSEDSMPYDIENQILYLYRDAFIKYEDIELKAGMIAINLETRTLFATFLTDTAGQKVGRPEFKQGDEMFTADTMYYNFVTKRGYIKTLLTEQQGGFLHAETTKRQENGHVCLESGKFTTCNAADPHFYISLKRAILIPNDKIISGPLNLVISDIPTPAYLPFGFFPNQKKFSSGILMPEYGEEANRGFYLRNGGYYFALSDYFDLALRGDIYSKGTWGAQLATNYKKMYAFSGTFNFRYYRNVIGEEPFYPTDSTKSSDFSVKWSHKQDAKSTPGQNFSANVNFSTSSFDKNQTTTVENKLQNTKSSSISYSKTWSGIASFSADLRHSQNSQTELVSLTLPSLTFNVNRQYPFRKKTSTGNFAWYENIQVEYKSAFVSDLEILEENFMNSNLLDSLETGFKHEIPLSANFKFWNFFNFSPSVGYVGKLYPYYKYQEWDPSYQVNDTTFGKVVETYVHKITYAHTISPVASLSFNPTFYGMYLFKRGKVKAIRHVMTPSITANWKPPMGSENDFIFRPVVLGQDSVSTTKTYSIYDGSKYGAPAKNSTSGSVSFSLSNNFEMKTVSKSDTGDVEKKTKLLENLTFRTRYDFYKDEKKLDPVTFTGNTTLFKDVKINFGGTLNPYALDSSNVETANWSIVENGKLFRLTQANLSLSYSIRGKQKNKDKPESGEELQEFEVNSEDSLKSVLEQEGILGDPERDYINFNLPWSLRVDYQVYYSKPQDESTYSMNLRFGGDINLTEKWKVALNSGYDFNRKEFTYTTIDIYRDLHCWEARFSWVPFGTYMSYNFQISVKPGMLQDLKLTKRKSWYDNF